MLDLIGHHLGDYEILQWLGEGAHVHAYLARRKGTDTNVVIKTLKSHLAATNDFYERFNREAEAAVHLDHPNIVHVLEYNRDGATLYLVEQFMAKGSLLDIFSKNPGPLPLDMIVKTLDQIASVLDYAHEKGIIHRDLKPENILFDADGNAHLSDLGITKTIDPNAVKTRSDLEFGNPGYMSPEEWKGEQSDSRADIYALGIILFQMLTGQTPFDNHFAQSMVYTHLMHLLTKPKSVLELRPELPAGVEPVIARAIEKDREKRFNTAGELATAFRAALNQK